jgi:2-C-methyl-D-erythritol 2,4-cyclodiphosphate synthase
MDIRVGHGYDLHRLTSLADGGKPMVIGGVHIESAIGPVAHSDGDAVMHAIADAILSAAGEPDLGTLFPDNESEHEDKDSKEFLIEAMDRINSGGWAIGNITITVICDEPKIAPHREQICTSLRALTGAPVNIKGKTNEGTSRDEAIEVHVVALIQRGNSA